MTLFENTRSAYKFRVNREFSYLPMSAAIRIRPREGFRIVTLRKDEASICRLRRVKRDVTEAQREAESRSLGIGMGCPSSGLHHDPTGPRSGPAGPGNINNGGPTGPETHKAGALLQ